MRVNCIAQEHNTMSLAWARTRTARSGGKRINHEAGAFPVVKTLSKSSSQTLRKREEAAAIFNCVRRRRTHTYRNAMRFQRLGAILDWLCGTDSLDLMC